MKIDPEFRGLIPPLSDEEHRQLEENIRRDGCRDPLVVWSGEDVLLDGHNRLEICERLSIPYAVKRVALESREKARQWIILNQLGRRNLRPDQASYLRGLYYNAEKKPEGRPEKLGNSCPVNGATAERLAPRLGVSPRTLKSDGAFAEAVDSLRDIDPDLPRVIASGHRDEDTKAPPRKDVIEAARVAAEAPEKALEILKTPHVARNSGNNEWYTPPLIVGAAQRVLGKIDLDPATSEIANKCVGAERYFTAETNGLEQPWAGRVWMNPPYANPLIGQFCTRLLEHIASGAVIEAIVLVNNATETAWGQALLGKCSAVCLPSSRVKFLTSGGEKGAPLQGQMITYHGARPEAFKAEFAAFGVVLHG